MTRAARPCVNIVGSCAFMGGYPGVGSLYEQKPYKPSGLQPSMQDAGAQAQSHHSSLSKSHSVRCPVSLALSSASSTTLLSTSFKFCAASFAESISPRSTTLSPRTRYKPRATSDFMPSTMCLSCVSSKTCSPRRADVSIPAQARVIYYYWGIYIPPRTMFENWSNDRITPTRCRPSLNTTNRRLSNCSSKEAAPGSLMPGSRIRSLPNAIVLVENVCAPRDRLSPSKDTGTSPFGGFVYKTAIIIGFL